MNTETILSKATVRLTGSGIEFKDLPLIVACVRGNGSEYYEFAPEVSTLDVTSDALSADAWLFILDVIEYSINEGGDTSRTVEAGDEFPAFSYQAS